MSHLSGFQAFPPSDTPGPDLFMTVLKVVDWSASVTWYVERLGLLPLLRDDEHQFALLAAGSGRIAIQGETQQSAGQRSCVRLVFLVNCLEVERTRLEGRGVDVGMTVENEREGYREFRLDDPDGTPITFFSWTGGDQGKMSGYPPE